MSRTQVHYIIPADGDEVDHPNVFSVTHPIDGLRLKQAKKAFPVPGTYHFRTKFKWKSTFVWLDVTDENSVLPTFDGRVFMKAVRMKRSSKDGGGGGGGNRARRGGKETRHHAPPTSSSPAPLSFLNNGSSSNPRRGMNGSVGGNSGGCSSNGNIGISSGAAIERRDSEIMFAGFTDADDSNSKNEGRADNASSHSLLHMGDPSPCTVDDLDDSFLAMGDGDDNAAGGDVGGDNLLDISMDPTTPKGGGSGTDMSDLWS